MHLMGNGTISIQMCVGLANSACAIQWFNGSMVHMFTFHRYLNIWVLKLNAFKKHSKCGAHLIQCTLPHKQNAYADIYIARTI